MIETVATPAVTQAIVAAMLFAMLTLAATLAGEVARELGLPKRAQDRIDRLATVSAMLSAAAVGVALVAQIIHITATT